MIPRLGAHTRGIETSQRTAGTLILKRANVEEAPSSILGIPHLFLYGFTFNIVLVKCLSFYFYRLVFLHSRAECATATVRRGREGDRRSTMAKGATKAGAILVKLVSTAQTGFFYVRRKNPKKLPKKLEFIKYDPRVSVREERLMMTTTRHV